MNTGSYDDAQSPYEDFEDYSPGKYRMRRLQAFAGGYEALMDLDDEPLPNEAFEWSSVDPQDEAFVTDVLRLVDACCRQMLDDEYRTIARRILARVAIADPRVLRRSPHADRCAAGLVWLAGRGSGAFARRGRRPRGPDLWRWFGVTNCSDRGYRLRLVAGLFPEGDIDYVNGDELALGAPELLHSAFRKGLIMQRDAQFATTADAQGSPIVSHVGDRLVVSAERVEVLGAAKSLPVKGERLGICIVLGTELESARCYDLSIPDARKLVNCMQAALNDPPPDRGRPINP